MKTRNPILWLEILLVLCSFLLLIQCGDSGGGDDEQVGLAMPPSITVTIESDSVLETDMVLTGEGKVSLSTPAGTDLEVDLASDDFVITVPAGVTVPAGQSSATFDLTVNNIDNMVDRLESLVEITASASGWIAGSDVIIVDDDDCDYQLVEGGTYSFTIDSGDIEQTCLGPLEATYIDVFLNTVDIPDITLPAGEEEFFPYVPDPGIELPFIGLMDGTIDIGENGRLEVLVDTDLSNIFVPSAELGGFFSLTADLTLEEAEFCSTASEVLVAFTITVESASLYPPLYVFQTPCSLSVTMSGTLAP